MKSRMELFFLSMFKMFQALAQTLIYPLFSDSFVNERM